MKTHLNFPYCIFPQKKTLSLRSCCFNRLFFSPFSTLLPHHLPPSFHEVEEIFSTSPLSVGLHKSISKSLSRFLGNSEVVCLEGHLIPCDRAYIYAASVSPRKQKTRRGSGHCSGSWVRGMRGDVETRANFLEGTKDGFGSSLFKKEATLESYGLEVELCSQVKECWLSEWSRPRGPTGRQKLVVYCTVRARFHYDRNRLECARWRG